MRARFAVAMAVVLGACAGDEQLGASQQSVISDQVHSGGTTGFYFLPPLVPQPTVGALDAARATTVEIDELDTGRHIATFLPGSGPGFLHVDSNGYGVSWRTDLFDIDAQHIYRITVEVEGEPAGYADVQVVLSNREAKNVDRDEYIPLVDGKILQIKFWIDECALSPEGTSCAGNTGTCQANTCVQRCAGVSCEPADDCHVAGVCDPYSGTCSTPAAPDGTSCAGGSGTCTAGSCVRSTNSNVCSGGLCASCAAIKAAAPSSPDGVYTLETAEAVYCDMTTDGGGWQLCAAAVTGDPDAHYGFDAVNGGSPSPTAAYSRDCRAALETVGTRVLVTRAAVAESQRWRVVASGVRPWNPAGAIVLERATNPVIDPRFFVEPRDHGYCDFGYCSNGWVNGYEVNVGWDASSFTGNKPFGIRGYSGGALGNETNVWHGQIVGDRLAFFVRPGSSNVCNGGLCGSCAAIKTAAPTSPDGVYTIDADGNGAGAPEDVHCNMTLDGGGWMLCASAVGSDPDAHYGFVQVNAAAPSPTSAYSRNCLTPLRRPGNEILVHRAATDAWQRWSVATSGVIPFDNTGSIRLDAGHNSGYGVGYTIDHGYCNWGYCSNQQNGYDTQVGWGIVGKPFALHLFYGEYTNIWENNVIPDRLAMYVREQPPAPSTSCGTSCASNVCDGGLCESCRAIQAAAPGSLDGTYTIDAGAGPELVHCNMTLAGGGWTLCASAVASDPDAHYGFASVNAAAPQPDAAYSRDCRASLNDVGSEVLVTKAVTGSWQRWSVTASGVLPFASGGTIRLDAQNNTAFWIGATYDHGYCNFGDCSFVQSGYEARVGWGLVGKPFAIRGFAGGNRMNVLSGFEVSDRLAFYVREPAAPPSCAAIHAATPAAPSGVYAIQPPGATAPFDAYCDMTTDGGGWTLMATLATTDMQCANNDATAVWGNWSDAWFARDHGSPADPTVAFSNRDARKLAGLISPQTVLRANSPGITTSRYHFGFTTTDWELWNAGWNSNGANVIGPFNLEHVYVSTSPSLGNAAIARNNGHWSNGCFLLGTSTVWSPNLASGTEDGEGLHARYHVGSSTQGLFSYVGDIRTQALWHLWLK